MPILEKAFAKLFVNYISLDGGYQPIAFRALTNMPIITNKAEDLDDFRIINKADKNNHLISASCINTKHGLIAYHAYTVMSAHTLSDGTKLVRMRNPWGREAYTGPWCDDCGEWNDEYKKEVNYVNDKTDGIFFMPYELFVFCFPYYYVVIYDENLIQNR